MISGVAEGDNVVVAGQGALDDGQKIKTLNSEYEFLVMSFIKFSDHRNGTSVATSHLMIVSWSFITS